PALVGDVTGLGIEHGLPGPGKHARVVTAHLEGGGAGEPVSNVATFEESVEGERTPCLERVHDVLGVSCLGGKRVVEKLLQVPAQLAHQVGVGVAFHRKLVRRTDSNRRGGLAVRESGYLACRRSRPLDMLDCQYGSATHGSPSLRSERT